MGFAGFKAIERALLVSVAEVKSILKDDILLTKFKEEAEGRCAK